MNSQNSLLPAILACFCAVSAEHVDFVNGMGEVLPTGLPPLSGDATFGLLQQISAKEITNGIVTLLGLPEEERSNGLDNAAEYDLEESAGPSTSNATANSDAEAAKAKRATDELGEKKGAKEEKKRKTTEASELKAKNAMPPPPPRSGLGYVPYIKLGKMEFSAEKVNSNVLHARLKLSGREIHGRTLRLDGHADIHGALHLRGDGSLVKSAVSGKKFRATVFVNKKNVKSCGIAIGDEGGFFDHNDGYITYEPLSGKKGLRINSDLATTGIIYADGTLRLGGQGGKRISKQTKRQVHTLLETNRHMAQGGGFAVSETGGFFDFKDGYITYEPLDHANGFLVNSKLTVKKNAEISGDVKVSGTLTVHGGINLGKMGDFNQAFAGFHSKNAQLEQRVDELETTNKELRERLLRMESLMREIQLSKA